MRSHFTLDILSRFLEDFEKYIDLDYDVIGTSQRPSGCFDRKWWPLGRKKHGLFNRKELRANLDSKVHILLDCVDEPHTMGHDMRYYVSWAAVSFFSRNKEPEALLSPVRDNMTEEKTKFCSYMYKNKTNKAGSTLAVARHEFFLQMNQSASVDELQGKERYSLEQFNEAVALYAPYKFNIAFENSGEAGWISEKIVSAFLAGCVPIFRGSDYVRKFFNEKAFIDYDDFDRPEDLIEYVKEVGRDTDLYERYISQPPCTAENFQNLFWYRFKESSEGTQFRSERKA